MSKSRSGNAPYFRQYMKPKRNAMLKRDPEVVVESHLIRLKELDDELFSFWEDYWTFLAREREKRADDIINALFAARSEDLELKSFSRIVGAKYGHDPLCTVGSVVVPPGGRFNIGQMSTTMTSFHALYLAEDYQTAFAEKYLYRQDERLPNSGEYNVTHLQFDEPESNVHCKVNIQLESYLDLRIEGTLQEFVEAISDIEPTQDLQARALKLRMGKLHTYKNEKALIKNIFEDNYKQWGIWIDQPSNSQWLAHYAKLAGIQGVLYPSCRNTTGFNIAAFIENFANSEANVVIADEMSFVSPLRKRIDETNFSAFMHSTPGPWETSQKH